MVSVVGDGFSVRIFGLESVVSGLEAVRPKSSEEIKRVIKKGGQDVARDARSFASRFAFTGAYAASFGVRQLTHGVKVYSSDPGAGTIEFANPGARYLRGKRAGRRIGVPRGASNPRALIPAVERNEPEIIRDVTQAIQNALDEVRGV